MVNGAAPATDQQHRYRTRYYCYSNGSVAEAVASLSKHLHASSAEVSARFNQAAITVQTEKSTLETPWPMLLHCH